MIPEEEDPAFAPPPPYPHPFPLMPLPPHHPVCLQVPELVAYLKAYFPVQPGDWILTGTPEGVSALKTGDRVTAALRHGERTLSEGNWVVAVSPDPGAWKQ